MISADVPCHSSDANQTRQQFISDVFHALSQPLAALRCSLEVALLKNRSAEEYRSIIENALIQTERAIQSASFVRQMAEAEDPGHPKVFDFGTLVAEVAGEFGLVAGSKGIQVDCKVNSGTCVCADPQRVQRALFYVFDAALSSADSGSTLFVTLENKESVLRVVVAASGTRAVCHNLQEDANERGMALAERIVVAACGVLRRESKNPFCCVMELRSLAS